MIARQKIDFHKRFVLEFVRELFLLKLVKGKYQHKFKTRFSQFVGLRHCSLVSSGRAAFCLILRVLNLKKHDEIILSSFNTPIVMNVIEKYGIKPVFVDSSEDNYNINPDLIEEKISSKTKAILVTHIEGYPCDMDSICSIAKKYNLQVIEDCAHAIGSRYKGRQVGTFGATSFFSFGISKHINTVKGGAVLTNDKEINNKINKLLNNLKSESIFSVSHKFIKYVIVSLLTNDIMYYLFVNPLIRLFRLFGFDILYYLFEDKGDNHQDKIKVLSNFQSFMGLYQLNKFDFSFKKIRNNVNNYKKYLSTSVKFQTSKYHAHPSYLNFTIRLKNRDYVIKKLMSNGIDIQKTWMHSLNCLNYSKKLSNEVLYLPIHSSIIKKDIVKISTLINKFKS